MSRRFCQFVAIAALALWAVVSALPSHAQTARTAAPTAGALEFGPIKGLIDQIEQIIGSGGQTDETLTALRDRLAPVREGIRAQLDVLDPRLAEVDERLTQLGEPPEDDTKAESKEIAAERKRLTQTRAEVDTAIKQTRLLATRADEIVGRINEQRRTMFARALFAHTVGVFDVAFWAEAGRATLSELFRIGTLLRSSFDYARSHAGAWGISLAALTLTALALAMLVVRRWLRRRLETADLNSRFARSVAAVAALLRHAATMPLVLLIVLQIFESAGLTSASVAIFGSGLVIATAVASFGRAVAIAVLAPRNPRRRLLAIATKGAIRLARHFIWAARVLGAAIFVNIVLKATTAPLSLTVASSAALALLISGILLHLLLRLQPANGDEVEFDEFSRSVHMPWLRAVGWILVAVTAIALIAGYIGFAAFLLSRFLVLLAMVGALYVAAVFVDALFSDVLAGSAPGGRRFAAMVGLTPRGVDLIGTLLAGIIKIALALIAIFPVIGPWGVFAADFFGVVQDAMFGFRVGEITISLGAVLGAMAILFAGVMATRFLQRWLDSRFLPQTSLDPGLQNSVSALVGYAGIIAVLVFVLAELGIDLQKIAIIAGALSVGVGFGLQSIVSNFVSGLILLAERPIRVGDWVVVKNDEGFVRRISVRATEIETFDRASVIIPNSEFITGVVKNWTHANTMGRITVKVGVSYDADPDVVQQILMSCAVSNQRVMATPEPHVFLAAFGDKALEFELRCIVDNVQDALAVKSELHFAILRRFRAASIGIPTVPAEVKIADRDGGEQPASQGSV